MQIFGCSLTARRLPAHFGLTPRLAIGVALMLGCPAGASAALFPGTGQVATDNVTVAARAPHVWVMLIHGGGWVHVGARYIDRQLPYARWLAAHGYGVQAVDYRAGVPGIGDLAATYDALHRQHPGVPVCVLGQSAGGAYALTLATLRPVACVIIEGAVVDFAASRRVLATQMNTAFGARWRLYSPSRFAGRIRVPVLAGWSAGDWDLPARQEAALHRALPSARIDTLAAGRYGFTHAGVDRRALVAWQALVLQVLART